MDLINSGELCSIMDSMFSFFGLYFNNADPDVRVIEFLDDDAYYKYVQDMVAGRKSCVYVVENRLEGTIDRCPYFKIYTVDSGDKLINLKLQSFLTKIGSADMNCLFSDACVVGLHSCYGWGIYLSVPRCLYITPFDHFDADIDGEIDLACLHPCGLEINRGGNFIKDIAGTELPVWLPPEVQWNILSYCCEPTAQLIKDEINKIRGWWGFHLDEMYYQRAWREHLDFPYVVPVPSARATIDAVTKPYLVSFVPESVSAPYRPWSL